MEPSELEIDWAMRSLTTKKKLYMKEKMKKNEFVLGLAMALFTLITASQFLAALISNSDALLVDCASMLADIVSYAGNLWSEMVKGKVSEQGAAVRAMIASGASILLLYSITLWGLIDAVNNLTSTKVPKDDLKPSIVLIFGLLGIFVDAVSLLAFSNREDAIGKESEVNMETAIGHLIADSFRSITSVILGIVVITDSSVNGARADAYATLIVASSIIVGSTHLVRQWINLATEVLSFSSSDSNKKRPEEDTDLSPSLQAKAWKKEEHSAKAIELTVDEYVNESETKDHRPLSSDRCYNDQNLV